MSELAATVKAWDTAAQGAGARRAIHPLGNNAAAYEASGRARALELAELIGPPGPGNISVIDFGAGDGRIAIPLAALGYGVLAVDASPTMLDRLNELAPELPTVLSDGRDLAGDIGDALLEDDPVEVDVIFALAVLIHHRHADAEVILAGLARALRPGGRLLVDLSLYEVAREPAAWSDIATWTPDELAAAAERAGLELGARPTSPGAFAWGQPLGPHHGTILELRRKP